MKLYHKFEQLKEEIKTPQQADEIILLVQAAKLEILLVNHDWYYHMSDDHGVWKRGQEQWKNIAAMREVVGDQVWRGLVDKHRKTI